MADEDDKPETRLASEGRMSAEHFGVINTPVYRATTILYPDLKALMANSQPYTYGRRGTPSTESFEDAISSLEGGNQNRQCHFRRSGHRARHPVGLRRGRSHSAGRQLL